MLALSVRQPYAELILRGIKTVEYRSQATKIVGERFYLYAVGKWPAPRTRRATTTANAWSLDLAMPGPAGSGDGAGVENAYPASPASPASPAGLPPWMAKLANGLRLFPHDLPTGVIVGSAVVSHVSRLESAEGDDGLWQWHLAGGRQAKRLRKPTGHPQPVWFHPFG